MMFNHPGFETPDDTEKEQCFTQKLSKPLTVNGAGQDYMLAHTFHHHNCQKAVIDVAVIEGLGPSIQTDNM